MCNHFRVLEERRGAFRSEQLECLPALQHDLSRPEDVLKFNVDEDGNGGDDAADALRYLIASKGRTVAVRKLVGV